MPTLEKRVRELREARGWTQVQLGVYAGISPSTVNLIEHGHRNPNATTLQKLATALGVEPGALFAESDSPKEKAPSPPPETSEEERRGELERLGDLAMDMYEQLEKDAERYRNAGDIYELVTFVARLHVEHLGTQQWIANEVRPEEREAAPRAYEALERMNELGASLVVFAQSSREAEQRRPRLTLIEGLRAG